LRIKNIKINNFGKLNNREINFDNNINLIYGKNEAGKTTLLKFISGMLYGISKNKNGKEFSDFERYNPWNGQEFSGKLAYQLDNKTEYEVYRDFTKKNPQIFCEGKDISKEFNIDKTKGNEFFLEQTKVDEQLFLNTSLVEQQAVKLSSQGQLALTQKIANIISTGEENTSYKKVIDKLNKKILEEIGTERSIERPINIIKNELEKLEKEKEAFSDGENKNKQIKEEITVQKNKLKEKQDEYNLKKEIKKYKETEKIKLERININKNIQKENSIKIEELKNNKIETKEEKKKNKEKFLIFFLVLISIIVLFLPIKWFVKYPVCAISIILIVGNILKIAKNKKRIKMKQEEIEKKNLKILNEIDILKRQIEEKEQEIEKIQQEISNEQNLFLVNQTNLENILQKDLNKLFLEIESLEREISSLKVQINILEIEEKNIKEKINNKAEVDEKIERYQEQEKELLKKEKLIKQAKEILEASYENMKKEITPQFTKNISKISEEITNGKYKNIIFDENEGLIVELENGEKVKASKLSIGTIDQLYLALRLSSMQEISSETMPIILDETFAYYDDERMENILKFINEYYYDKQVLIFTCSQREKIILEKLNIKHNFIKI